MAPRLIEVSADMKDFAEDALKALSILATTWLIQSFWLRDPSAATFERMAQMGIMVLAGLGIHHLIVDDFVLRFVVKSGQEGMYEAMRKYR